MSPRSGVHRLFWTFDGNNKKIGHCQCLQTCSKLTLRNGHRRRFGCLSADTRPISRGPLLAACAYHICIRYILLIYTHTRARVIYCVFFFFYFFMCVCMLYVHDIRFTFSKLGITITCTVRALAYSSSLPPPVNGHVPKFFFFHYKPVSQSDVHNGATTHAH